MKLYAATLFELLPAIYRLRDRSEHQGAPGPLEALLGIVAEQASVLDEDVHQLYADQFIETCADWVIPYIGDLIGVRALHPVVPGVASGRAEVANTIGYRRRKGTAAMLEQLARDVTGWDARVVEFFDLLAATQYMQHIRVDPSRGGTLAVRDETACESLTTDAGAFDTAAHTVDVRRTEPARRRHNIPNVGIFLWRLSPYPLARATARFVSPGCYTFNPLGLDGPLFNQSQREPDVASLAEPVNVAHLLRRRPLRDELEARRRALVDDVALPPGPYFDARPVLAVFVDGDPTPIPPEQVLICDLTGPAPWRRPPPVKRYPRRPTRAAEAQPRSEAMVARAVRVAVDPELGRLAFPAGSTPSQVQVSFSYGFSADLGGGPYDRAHSLPTSVGPVVWQRGVSQETSPVPGEITSTLAEAVQEWNQQPPGTVGVIAVLDNGSYDERLVGASRIAVPASSHLLIVAAGWPQLDDPDAPGRRRRLPGRVTPSGLRPHVRGRISVVGTAPADEEPGRLVLNGLLLEEAVTVLVGNLGGLELSHCTIAPPAGLTVTESVTSAEQNRRLRVVINDSITGAVLVPESVPSLLIKRTVVDGGRPTNKVPAVVASGAEATLEACTMLGTTEVRTIEASNSIFVGAVVARRRQVGCVRFSYVPTSSRIPRRYRCQPEDDIHARRVGPDLTSTRYGDASYCQLGLRCPPEILAGADDGAEMGAFHDLYQPQRLANLRLRLDEYLRFGLDAGVVYAT